MSEVAVSERKQALREIAKERAGIQGKALSQTYPEEDERGQQGTEGGMPFEQISPEKIILERRRDDDSAFNWTQFAPWERGGERKGQNRSIPLVSGLWQEER